MYRKTITLFNYHGETDSWYTTVFIGADLIENSGANATRQGETNSAAVDLIVHVQRDKKADTIVYKPKRIADAEGNILVSGEDSFIIYGDPVLHADKQYAGPKAYAAIENPRNYFTFTPESDFFIVGNYYSDAPISDADFEDGLYSAMNAAHDGVYMITSAAFYSLLPHFEIGGR